jgi:Holliday junction resolvase
MSGKMSRNKGAAAERELAALLTDELGFVVKRKLGQAREGGDDIQVGHFKIEAKRRENLSIMQWVRQIEACTAKHEVPIVAFRQSQQEWRVVVRLRDFIPMLREFLTEVPE